jgi:tetratricopeptide (TPR) repeat protein
MTLLSRASRIRHFRLVPLTALLLATPMLLAAPQQAAPVPAPGQQPAPVQQDAPRQLKKRLVEPPAATSHPAAAQGQTGSDRSSAYYHYGLAHLYEEMAVNAGRPDYATQAVEEYKRALDADPNSEFLQDGLADLYFKIGRIKEAVTAAQDQVKRNPDDVGAHTLLGQVYLRSLGDMQGTQSAEMLRLAIAEYETIARLKPNDLETKLLLGQLYGLNHDSAKAETTFKDAQKIDGDSEDVVLNMARLYLQNGESQRAVDTLSAVPVSDRTARIEFELGASLDAMKKWKEAAAAYRRSLDLEPDNPDGQRAMAKALQADDQSDEALKVFRALVAADPTDAESEVHISEILRRQGHYEDALATLEKAKLQAPDSLEIIFNEALIYDALGKYDQATGVLTTLAEGSSHPDGKYSDQEKQNRAIFLNRLGSIYREEDKTAEAVATYKQIVDMGGDCSTNLANDDDAARPCYSRDGYQGEVDAYRDAHQWKEATAAAAEAAKAFPKDHIVQLMYAQQLADMGQVEQGLTLAKAQLTGGASDRDVEEELAQMYIRLKRFPEASEQLDKAAVLATKPDEKLYAIFLRGELYDREKMHDQAETEFRKALAIDPQNAAVLNYLGYMLADLGQKLPEALKMIRQAVDLEPQNGAYLDSLGWAYFKTGQYTQAEENLRKANERMNTDPTVHDHLGEVYEKNGNLKMAVAQWERSMTEYAHSLPADADPEDVQKVQHKLENARVKLAKVNPESNKVAH